MMRPTATWQKSPLLRKQNEQALKSLLQRPPVNQQGRTPSRKTQNVEETLPPWCHWWYPTLTQKTLGPHLPMFAFSLCFVARVSHLPVSRGDFRGIQFMKFMCELIRKHKGGERADQLLSELSGGNSRTQEPLGP